MNEETMAQPSSKAFSKDGGKVGSTRAGKYYCAIMKQNAAEDRSKYGSSASTLRHVIVSCKFDDVNLKEKTAGGRLHLVTDKYHVAAGHVRQVSDNIGKWTVQSLHVNQTHDADQALHLDLVGPPSCCRLFKACRDGNNVHHLALEVQYRKMEDRNPVCLWSDDSAEGKHCHSLFIVRTDFAGWISISPHSQTPYAQGDAALLELGCSSSGDLILVPKGDSKVLFFQKAANRQLHEAVQKEEARMKQHVCAQIYSSLVEFGYEDGKTMYYPNRYRKKHACCPSCDGVRSKCRHPDPSPNDATDMCWRPAFRYHLRETQYFNGFFLQVVDDHCLGEGQREEMKWAQEIGIECFHVYRNHQGGLQFREGFYQEAQTPTRSSKGLAWLLKKWLKLGRRYFSTVVVSVHDAVSPTRAALVSEETYSHEELSRAEFEVIGCGLSEFNGLYRQDGEKNGRPKFRQIGSKLRTCNYSQGRWYLGEEFRGDWYHSQGSQSQIPLAEDADLPFSSSWAIGESPRSKQPSPIIKSLDTSSASPGSTKMSDAPLRSARNRDVGYRRPVNSSWWLCKLLLSPRRHRRSCMSKVWLQLWSWLALSKISWSFTWVERRWWCRKASTLLTRRGLSRIQEANPEAGAWQPGHDASQKCCGDILV